MSHVDPNRDSDYAEVLMERAKALQLEAQSVMRNLGLCTMLEQLGPVEVVGSVVSGLMVWRDIDICVDCPDLTLDHFWEALRPLLIDPKVTRIDFRNETGDSNPSDDPNDQRLYMVVHYESEPGTDWKIDLSLWTHASPGDPGALLTDLQQRLTHETRLAIMWIKDVWYRLPVYPYEVGGFEVYDAVLNHGVRTPEDFDRYLRQHGLPGRA